MISNSDVINWVFHNSRVWESNGNYYTTFQGKHFLLSIQVNEAPYARTRLVEEIAHTGQALGSELPAEGLKRNSEFVEEIDPPKWEKVYTRGQFADSDVLTPAEAFAYNVITETNPNVWAKIMEREAGK